MDWSQETCLLLIEAYHDFRCLWDPTFENYKDTIQKEDAWQEIANQLGCCVEEVKKKMDSLLASYRRERQKSIYTKTGSAADCTYKSKWFAFKSMQFLMYKYKPRKTLGFDANRIQKTDETIEQENERNEQGADEMGSNGGTQSDLTTHPQPSTSSQRPDNTVKQSVTESRQIKRPKTEDPRVFEAYNILKDTYQSRLWDRSQAFGNHIASKHREYSKRTQAIVEHCINNILFDADMGKYDSCLTSTPFSSFSDNSQNTLTTVEEPHYVNIDIVKQEK